MSWKKIWHQDNFDPSASVGPGAGTYGNTGNQTKIDTITLDAQGRVTDITTGTTGDITGVAAGSGLTGGGDSGTPTISHDNTSDQASVNNSGNTVIQDVTLDTFGHVTGLNSTTLSIPPGTITGVTTTGPLSGGGTSGNITLSITDNSIGDTQLAYNTGQDLTTTSSPTFHNITIDSENQDEDQLRLKHSDSFYMDIRHRGHFNIVGGNDFKFKHAGTTRLCIKESNGSVGIGTTNPDYKLHVVGNIDNDDVAIKIHNTSDDDLEATPPRAALLLSAASNNAYFRCFGAPSDLASGHKVDIGSTATDSFITFTSNNSERMRITSAGDVGIGTSSPSANLEVYRNNSDTDKQFSINQDGSGDPVMTFRLTGVEEYAMGIDNSDGDKFKISSGGTLGSDDLLTIKNDGRVGIGTTDPNAMIHIIQSQDGAQNEAGNALRIESSNNNSWWNIGTDNDASNAELAIQFKNTTGGGYLNATANIVNITFTGQHYSLPASGQTTDYSSSIGMIVVSSGEYTNLYAESASMPTINESLPKVLLSNEKNQKSVYGVISETEDPNATIRKHKFAAWGSNLQKNDNRIIVNSLGEGAIWVTNCSGSLENGDYITSSPIPGLGMKQDDDLLHNYTVAKITQDCDFRINSTKFNCVEFEWSGSTYRKAFVGCTYHCG